IHLVLGVTVLPYLLGTATYNQWWAGYAPAARFLVVLTPLLAFYVAATLQRLHHWTVTALAIAAGIFGYALGLVGDIVPRLRFHPDDKGNQAMVTLGKLVGVAFEPHLPNGLRQGDRLVFLAWGAILVAFAGLLWLIGRWTPATRIPDQPAGFLRRTVNSRERNVSATEKTSRVGAHESAHTVNSADAPTAGGAGREA
ncbi:MAG TPA: hypothetical protein VF755_26515, partial [Catenuloplanes sp.]